MGENHFDKNPVALYGCNLIFCAIGFTITEKILIDYEGKSSKLAEAFKNHNKENISLVLYIIGIGISFFYPLVSMICYGVVAMIWLIPDKRIEKNID